VLGTRGERMERQNEEEVTYNVDRYLCISVYLCGDDGFQNYTPVKTQGASPFKA